MGNRRNSNSTGDTGIGFKELFKGILGVVIVLTIISLLLDGIIRICLLVIKLTMILVGAGLIVGIFGVMVSAVVAFIAKLFIDTYNKYGRRR